MTDDRWGRVKALVGQALSMPDVERARFLDDACHGDAALRREVDELLAADQTDSFLERPPVADGAMMLQPGARLGPYAVIAKIGAGGMGEVYRARDTTLDRDVALKVLPAAFTSDPDRLARFEREAKVLASLNHPNIGSIYGLEESEPSTGSGQGAVKALVLELIEGPTLADVIAGSLSPGGGEGRGEGGLPIDDVLSIATQIAEALEAAHEIGVIHRDLKPANVKVKADGAVKVLDFGLAKAFQRDASDPSESPTVTAAATHTGVILGTAAYMSPEQARGQPVDPRTDVWAFGALLYEMLSGRRAFGGADVPSTLVAVLSGDVDLDALPPATPPRLRQVLRTCLRKEPRQRVHHIADVRLAIEGAFESSVAPAEALTAGDSPGARLGLAAAGAVAVAALAVGVGIGVDRTWFRPPDTGPARELTRLGVDVLPGHYLSGGSIWELRDEVLAPPRPSRQSFVLTPDGLQLFYAASDGETRRLYRRPMDREQSTPIPGTEGGSSPFMAPDGRSVGFFVGTELKRVALDGGQVRTITTAGGAVRFGGASWTERDTILVSDAGIEDGIFEVPANGGTLSRLIARDPEQGGFLPPMHPELLPGGRAVLFNVPTGDIPVVVEDLMHAEGGSNTGLSFGAGQFSVSRSGALAYVPGGIYPLILQPLVWVSPDGVSEPLPLPPGMYYHPRFSPDGTRLAYTRRTQRGDTDIWVYDIELQVPDRLTSTGMDRWPIWSPDGAQLAFASSRDDAVPSRFLTASDGSGEPRRLTDDSDTPQIPSSWSSGHVLAFI